MTFIEPRSLPSHRSINDDAMSWLGPLSKTLAELPSYIVNSASTKWMAPPVSIHTTAPALQSPSPIKTVIARKALKEELFDTIAAFKIKTSSVAMYLDDEWRHRFFRQLDSLLQEDSWDPDDTPPSMESFSTLLRMLLLISPERRPGLGATSDGEFVAAWTAGDDRLTIRCLPNDRVRWVLSCELDGERETATGSSTLSNLKEVLSPYRPHRWFRAKHQT